MNEKRTELISLRLTPADLERFEAAAKVLWPGAVLTRSGIVLGLCRMLADQTLKGVQPSVHLPNPHYNADK